MDAQQWELASGATCPRCRRECYRIVALPLGGNGCAECLAQSRLLRSKIPNRLATAITGIENGELSPMVTHMRDICPRGHPAVHRYDPGGAGYTLICLSCSSQGAQMYEGVCVTCGQPCYSIYKQARNGTSWRIRCAAGHTKSRML